MGNNLSSIIKRIRFVPIIAIIVISLFVFLSTWYLFLPALNLHSVGFWIYLLVTSLTTSVLINLILDFYDGEAPVLFIVPGLILILMTILIVTSGVIFNAKAHSELIEIDNSSFENDIKEASFDQVPTVDRDTAIRLGSRKMGEILDLVSQYNVANYYTQINYKDKPVRVTPLKYNGFIKWFGNRHEGIPNYIIVDMINGNTELATLNENIRYSKSDKFSRNITRHIRTSYPKDIISEISFEINDEGIPYWVTPVYKTHIGWFGGLDVTDVILTNAITGEHNKYKVEDTPNWVDRVYDASKVNKQLNWNGKLKSGYLNSMFSQKGVTMTTQGYNYLAINDDVYFYTGITSVGTDESNIGFVLVNMRTKDTKFYQISSAEEFSAMESAEGAIQEKGYKSTFPILLNINSKPTYFMSLKDDAGLVKAYALVDAKSYQNVTIDKSVSEVVASHSGDNISINDKNTEEIEKEKETLNIKGSIVDIRSGVVNGDTHYYLIIDSEIFVANINLLTKLPFLSIGDEIDLDYHVSKSVNKVTKITLIQDIQTWAK